MEGLNDFEKIIIDNYFTYENFVFGILDCVERGDKLVVYRGQEGDIKFANYEIFSKFKEGNLNVEILYISGYIKKHLNFKELDNTINSIIGDMKEKSDIYVEKFDNKLENIQLNHCLSYLPKDPLIVGEMKPDEAFKVQRKACSKQCLTLTSRIDAKELIRILKKYSR